MASNNPVTIRSNDDVRSFGPVLPLAASEQGRKCHVENGQETPIDSTDPIFARSGNASPPRLRHHASLGRGGDRAMGGTLTAHFEQWRLLRRDEFYEQSGAGIRASLVSLCVYRRARHKGAMGRS